MWNFTSWFSKISQIPAAALPWSPYIVFDSKIFLLRCTDLQRTPTVRYSKIEFFWKLFKFQLDQAQGANGREVVVCVLSITSRPLLPSRDVVVVVKYSDLPLPSNKSKDVWCCIFAATTRRGQLRRFFVGLSSSPISSDLEANQILPSVVFALLGQIFLIPRQRTTCRRRKPSIIRRPTDKCFLPESFWIYW